MTKDRMKKLAARAYAEQHGVPYTQALREVAAARTSTQTNSPPAVAPALARTSPFTRMSMLPTQMTVLDGLLGGGLPRGEVTALWAPTGTGTSMFGLTLARMTAKAAQHAVVVTAESATSMYVERIIAATTGIATRDLARGVTLPESWPPDWQAYLHLYDPERLPTDPRQTANELRADAMQTGRAPTLIVIDDLRPFQIYATDAPEVFADLARDLQAAVVVIDALPSALCRTEPSEPDEFDDITTLGWPHRVPEASELLASEQTEVLARTATTTLILTEQDTRPDDEVVVLDVTVRTRRGPGGITQVRRDGPRARILVGAR